ncbi:MAG: FKBP-type peptidyl-prolyl cis-trans isomerase [Actinomycetota bacterium]|nr:FKBP-type peptidyl-prolyl cis-trans isomerase [Actinomycetota bacterium]
MRTTRRWAVAAVTLALLASCGQPNSSDTPGAAGAPQSSPPAPSPSAVASAPAVSTPCTKGQVTTTAGGLKIQDTKCGTGPPAVRGGAILVKYVGKLASGKVFDSTAKHGGKAAEFQVGVGMLIPGWDEGIPGMRVGGVRKLIIPPALGYGASGSGPIPPNATLNFTIKLVGLPPVPSPS